MADAPLYQCSFCPTDPKVVCVTGAGILRFLHLEQNDIKSIGISMGANPTTTTAAATKPGAVNTASASFPLGITGSGGSSAASAGGAAGAGAAGAAATAGGGGAPPQQNYLCHCWVDDRILVGTEHGEILVFENAEYRGALDSSPSQDGKSIDSIAAFSKGESEQ
jgi:hypothetical protein